MGQVHGLDIESIFEAALERQAPAERAAYLDAACAGDASLRARVEALLRAHQRAGTFLNQVASWPGVTQATADASPLAREGPGARIGPYKLLQLIGEGGFGSVFMADQESPVRRRVALKIIKLGMDTRQVIARFEAERQALAMMDHPNIAKVLDAGSTETGRPYFVMELVKGDPITEYADKNNLPISRRLELFVQVCQAVQHAHTKGIIHRDLKPTNVLVSTQDGRPFSKVIDFGIAKATEHRLTEKTLFTEHRALIGTPEYMSPEQAEGSLDIDTRTDVYSLGVLLYELLTGTTPFDSTKLRSAAFGEIQRIIREVEPPKPSTRLSENANTAVSIAAHRQVEPKKLGLLLRGDMDWIVMKALEKDRVRRYETASTLALDVQRHLDGQPVVAAPPSTAYRLRKFVRRHRGPVTAAALVAAALLLGVIATTAAMFTALQERNDKEQARQAEADQRAAAQASELIARQSAARATEEAARADQAAALARRKAAVADSTSQLLRDALASADRGQQGGNPNVTVREVMDQIAATLTRGTPAYEPEIEAAIRDIVGVTYRALGRYDEAEPHLRRALEIQHDLHGQDHTNIGQAQNNLGLLLLDRGKIDEAELLLREALEIDKRAHGDQSIETAETRQNLVAALAAKGERTEAEAVARATLDTRLRLLPPDHIDLATSMNALATLLSERGQLAEAESMYRGALDIVRKNLGPEHPKVSITLSNLGNVLGDREKFAEAVTVLRQALEMRRRLLGPDHPEVSIVLHNLATVENAMGDYPVATAHEREALAIARREHGNWHPSVAAIFNNLAMFQQNAGDLAGAEESFRESSDIVRRTTGPENPDYAQVMYNRARLAEAQGQLPRALTLLEEAMGILRRNVAPGHPLLVPVMSRAAKVRAATGDLPGAQTLIDETTQLARKLPEDHPERANALISIATAHLQMGQPDAAEPIAREAVALRDAAYPDSHPLVWRKYSARSIYGSVLLARAAGSLDAASKQPEGPGSARVRAEALELLQQAQPLIVPSYEAAKDDPRLPGAKPGVGPDRKREMLERVVRLYELLDRAQPGPEHAAKAAQWRAALESMPKRPGAPE